MTQRKVEFVSTSTMYATRIERDGRFFGNVYPEITGTATNDARSAYTNEPTVHIILAWPEMPMDDQFQFWTTPDKVAKTVLMLAQLEYPPF